MKITREEIDKIAKDYEIGKVIKYKLIKQGKINYNFDVKTNKGNFVIRILGHKNDKANKRKLKLEFKVLNFLKKNKFPYEIPYPIKNGKGIFLSKVNGKDCWVYKKLKGKNIKKINEEKIKNIAILLATYHKFVKKIKLNKNEKVHADNFFDLNWLLKKYSSMKKIRQKNNVNKLILENFKFFEDLLNKIKKIKFNKNIIITHSDFQKENFLFEGDKIKGLLDFDNLDTLPLIKDLASAIQNACFGNLKLNNSKMKLFLREYEEINKLSKEEKEMILPAILREKCIGFWWFYMELKKEKDKKYKIIKKIINEAKNLEKLK